MVGEEETQAENTENYNLVSENDPNDRFYAPTLMLKEEVNRLIEISKNYQEQIKTAKTQTKKNYFLKKLRKNNQILAGHLMRLNYINQIRAAEKNKIKETTESETEISGEENG